MKISMRRIVGEGERVPFGWAIAYWDWASFNAHAYPIGIHVIVKIARRLYWLIIRYKPTLLEQRMREARRAAYIEGVRQGRQQVLSTMERAIEEQVAAHMEAANVRHADDNKPV